MERQTRKEEATMNSFQRVFERQKRPFATGVTRSMVKESISIIANDKEGADRVSQDALNRRIGVQQMTLRQLLGIDLPIIQAPMAGAQGSAMAIAVSNAGGLGSLPCAMLSLE